MIKFYGSPLSSAGRTHWMLEEIGVPYEYHRVDLRSPDALADYRKVCPSGRIPYLVDGDVRLLESVAINLYLAERYAPELFAAAPIDRARIYQWSLWGITNMQPDALAVMSEQHFLPEAQRSAVRRDSAKKRCQKLIAELEAPLVTPYLMGARFSVADVNAGSVVNLALRVGAAEPGPRVAAWMERLRSRPAYQKSVQSA
jgi:glutathione S-transferase